MFEKTTYIKRRNKLKEEVEEGILLFLGNEASPINTPDNYYEFRQDSNFLYFWGLDEPGLNAVLDIDNDREIIFGNDPGIEETIWRGSQVTIEEKAADVGVMETYPSDYLKEILNTDRKIHFLPPYRAEHKVKLKRILNKDLHEIGKNVSESFIQAIIRQREVKSDQEILQIESAVDLAAEMHIAALGMVQDGMYEDEACGAMEGIARSSGSRFAFQPIFSIESQILHNHYQGNQMRDGDLLINDSGVESDLHYASDITRTLPVGGEFTSRQKDIYQIVLQANKTAINASEKGVKYKDVHLKAARIIVDGLQSLGLMQGNAKEAVQEGAYALFFPHGIGHMLGLDAHDMESLGEDRVGYDENTQRSDQFGLSNLRLGKELQPGFVVTVEPGIYFIPQLIDMWKEDNKFQDFINYQKVEEYKDFGGIRIEDDILITNKEQRILGAPIPKEIEEIKELWQE